MAKLTYKLYSNVHVPIHTSGPKFDKQTNKETI